MIHADSANCKSDMRFPPKVGRIFNKALMQISNSCLIVNLKTAPATKQCRDKILFRKTKAEKSLHVFQVILIARFADCADPVGPRCPPHRCSHSLSLPSGHDRTECIIPARSLARSSSLTSTLPPPNELHRMEAR